MTTQVPIADGLFSWPSDSPRLLASRCIECRNHVFPAQPGCPKCSGANTEIVELGQQGTLWTWTVQSYPPKSPPFAGNDDPATFKPYGVGYIDIEGKLLVESRLTVADPNDLAIGQTFEFVIDPLYTNEAGEEVVTFAFAPLTKESSTA